MWHPVQPWADHPARLQEPPRTPVLWFLVLAVAALAGATAWSGWSVASETRLLREEVCARADVAIQVEALRVKLQLQAAGVWVR